MRVGLSWKAAANQYGDECANYHCKIDKNWYCLWCAQQLNMQRNRKTEDGKVVQTCIDAQTALIYVLQEQNHD